MCHSEEAMTGVGVKVITFAVCKFSPVAAIFWLLNCTELYSTCFQEVLVEASNGRECDW